MDLNFKQADEFKKKIEQTVKQINSEKLPLVLFGCRNEKAISEFLKKINVEVKYICDNNPSKFKYTFFNCKTICPEELNNLYKPQTYNVFIFPKICEEEITEQLNGLKSFPNKIFSLDLYFYDSENSYIKSNLNRIEAVYDLLTDEFSKKTYQNIMNYRIRREFKLIDEVAQPVENQYFDTDIIKLSNNEIFVDGGAFTGDTIETFIKKTKGKFEKIYAFEPEKVNYVKLKDYVDHYKNIEAINCGISENSYVGKMNSFGVGSSISDEGDEKVKTDSIDDFLSKQANSKATFIKMDIEGFECKALKGAENTIKKYKPKLAICMYHSNEDMVNVPLLIHKIEPGYFIYIRHYTKGICDTVCYAVYNK